MMHEPHAGGPNKNLALDLDALISTFIDTQSKVLEGYPQANDSKLMDWENQHAVGQPLQYSRRCSISLLVATGCNL